MPVGAIVTLTATPDEGFRFNGWALEGFDLQGEARWKNPVYITMPANDIRVELEFLGAVENVLDRITDPVFKAYAQYRMTNTQTIVADTETINSLAWDTDGNGKLSEAEAAAVKAIDVSKETLAALTGFTWDGTAIKSLIGIEFFTGLEAICAANCKLTQLELRNFPELKTLILPLNQLTVLDITKCTKLFALDCHDNELTALDISKNSKLNRITCYRNHIERLDIRTLAVNPDGSYLFRCGLQRLGEGEAMFVKMGAAHVAWWNSVICEEPELQYNRGITTSL